MELKNNGKINFVIDLFINFKDQMSGGLVALHKLSYELAKRGHNVYIFCEPEYHHKNITVIPCKTEIIGSRFHSNWEFFSYNLNNTVSIYTEYNLNNPFGTEHITRWILYHTKKEFEQHYQEKEFLFNYGRFKTYKGNDDGILTAIEYNLDKLYIEKKSSRNGYCHILHKNTPDHANIELEKYNSYDLGEWYSKGGFEYLRKQFNKYEYFLTFDQETYLTTAAALCGCKSIILNPNYRFSSNKNAFTESEYYSEILTPTEYRIQNPLNMFGVAYGVDDVKWAEDTIHLVRDHIMELEKIDNKTIDKFVDFWNKKCYG